MKKCCALLALLLCLSAFAAEQPQQRKILKNYWFQGSLLTTVAVALGVVPLNTANVSVLRAGAVVFMLLITGQEADLKVNASDGLVNLTDISKDFSKNVLSSEKTTRARAQLAALAQESTEFLGGKSLEDCPELQQMLQRWANAVEDNTELRALSHEDIARAIVELSSSLSSS